LSKISTIIKGKITPEWGMFERSHAKDDNWHLTGFLIDWDAADPPPLSPQYKLYKHRTASGNWRFIVPFEDKIEFTGNYDYGAAYRKMLGDIILPEGKYDIDALIKSKKIDKDYITQPSKFARVRNSEDPIEFNDAKEFYNPEFSINKNKSEPVKFFQKQVKDEPLSPFEILNRVRDFLNHFKYILKWATIRTDYRICPFNFHDNDSPGLIFNDPVSLKNPANIRCYHSSCRLKLRETLYELVKTEMSAEERSKEKNLKNYTDTALYVTLGVMNGTWNLTALEACAFHKYPRIYENVWNLSFLSFNAARDWKLLHELLYESLIIKNSILYSYSNGYYSEIRRETIFERYLAAYFSYVSYKSECKGLKKTDWTSYLKSCSNVSCGEAINDSDSVDDGQGLCLENGILEFNPDDATYRFINHSHLYFYKSKMDYCYDVEAKCPTWIKILKDYFEYLDHDSVLLLQEFAGYCLTKERRMHTFLTVWGVPRAGKNTIVDLLASLVPSCAIHLKHLCDPKERESMVGSHLGFMGELVVKSSEETTSILKQITASDAIPIRPLYTPEYTTADIPKLIMSFNNPPDKYNIDLALKSRMKTIYFSKSFVGKEDRWILEKLIKERSGILNWALEGYVRLYKNRQFTSSDKENEKLASIATSEYSEVDEFLQSKLKEKNKWPVREIYDEYLSYCSESGLSDIVSTQNFGRRVRMSGFVKLRRNGEYVYIRV
jgi:P4 family phage/plasmid primase-like protien